MKQHCLLITVVVVALAIIQVNGNEEELIKMAKACEEETGFDGSKIEEYVSKKDSLPEEGYCFMKCVAEKMGVVKDGKINGDVVEQLKQQGKVATSCDLAGATVETCDDIKKFMEC